jgi:hypothetical protein
MERLMGKKATSDMDKTVEDLMAKVAARREKIGALQKPQWRTTTRLTLPGYETLNIQACSDTALLATMLGELMRRKQDIDAASKELEVDIEPKVQNYLIDDWIADIKLRVRITNIRAERAKLNALEAKLETLLSPEQRRALELAAIKAELE